MTVKHTQNRLHRHMINTVALEAQLEDTLAQLQSDVSGHPDVRALFHEFHQMVTSQREMLEERLLNVVANATEFETVTTTILTTDGEQSVDYPISTALQHIYTMFSQILMAYTTLQPLAQRFADSWVCGKENTADISKLHTQNYVRTLQRISQLIHDVVIWEMDQEGLSCTCTCPSCSIGICLCAISSRTVLSNAWLDAGSIANSKGVTVLPPRPASAASVAQLDAGEIIVAVDGHEIQKYSDLQTAIRSRTSGDHLEFVTQQETGEQRNVSLVIP